MKTITAKELQQNQSAVLKDVAAGQEYQVTFHKRPIVKLTPMRKPQAKKLLPGSHAAFLESLKYTMQATGDLRDLGYKELRARAIEDKHGK